MRAGDGAHAELLAEIANNVDLGVGVGRVAVDSHGHRDAELGQVPHVPLEVGATFAECFDILGPQIGLRDTALHLERLDRCDENDGVRRQPPFTTLDIEEFLGPQIGAKSGFRDDVVSQLKPRLRRHQRIAAVRDIGKRPAVHQARVVFHCLHQIRLQRILEQRRHGALHVQVVDCDGFVVSRVADDDFAKTMLEVLEIGCKAEYRHDFRGHGNVETGLTNHAIMETTEARRDAAQGTVVHIHDTPPRDPPGIDIELVFPVHVIVDQGREQVIGGANRMKVARKMQVDVGHRNDLGITAAGRAAFHAETRPEARLTQADQRVLSEQIHRVPETNRGRRLSLACRRRRHGCHQDQLSVLADAVAPDEVGADLGLVVAIGNEVFGGDAEPVGNLLDRFERRRTGNLDIAFHSHFGPFMLVFSWPDFIASADLWGGF